MNRKDWNFKVVKTGDKLNIGTRDLIFIEAPMLHWPDSMFCYLTGENILFSNDGFGQHLASELMYNDLVDQGELFQEAIKYFANILTPFSAQITLIYDTMWESTKKMAETIAKGILSADTRLTVKLFYVSKSDKNDVITEIFKSKAVLAGSPTVNKGILSSLAGLFEEIAGLRFKGKKAAAFGSYGWSGESVKMISEKLEQSRFELLNDGLREKWNPDSQAKKTASISGNPLETL